MKNPYKMILQNEGLPYKTLLGTSSTKTVKGEKLGFLTAILYLTPDNNICSMARLAGCMEGCLYSSGRGAFNSVQNARQAKNRFLVCQPKGFFTLPLCGRLVFASFCCQIKSKAFSASKWHKRYPLGEF